MICNHSHRHSPHTPTPPRRTRIHPKCRLILDLASLNIPIGLFNLIPAFPMNGGRILRVILAQHMNYSKATRIATITDRILDIALVSVGFLLPGHLLLIIISLFVYIGVNQEANKPNSPQNSPKSK